MPHFVVIDIYKKLAYVNLLNVEDVRIFVQKMLKWVYENSDSGDDSLIRESFRQPIMAQRVWSDQRRF